mgnify:CR=1 FL=1
MFIKLVRMAVKSILDGSINVLLVLVSVPVLTVSSISLTLNERHNNLLDDNV